MANGHDEFFHTLANSFRGVNLAKGGRNALINYVYRGIEPFVRARHEAIKIPFFDAAQSGAVENVAAGNNLTRRTPHLESPSITLAKHAVYAVPIYSTNLSKASPGYVDGVRDMAQKKIADEINGDVAALITPANFADYTPVDTGVDDDITDAAMGTAWSTLADADVPVGDMDNMFVISAPQVYSKLLQRESFTKNSSIGDPSAGIRRTARLGTHWGAWFDWDADLGLYQQSAGVYASLYFHRYAMGIVSAPLAPPMNPNVPCTYVSINGIPVRVIVDFDQDYMCDVISFDCLYGVGVIRSDHGILLANTE